MTTVTVTTRDQILRHTTAFLTRIISHTELRRGLIASFHHDTPISNQLTLRQLNLAADAIETAISVSSSAIRSSSLSLADKLLLPLPDYPLSSFLLSLIRTLRQTYERKAIEEWFNRGNLTCPITCHQLQNTHHLLRLLTSPPPKTRPFLLAPLAASSRGGSLRRADVPPPTTTELENRDPEAPKSRNQLKREAHRAVKWGMDLASFSPPQIKLILRVASLEQAVFDALMLVKRMGPDVREGKRRQFRYIGKLLRDVEPDLMDRLIRATKDSDQRELQALTGLVSPGPVDNDNLMEIEPEEEDEEEESNWDESQVTKWFDGLINKDIQITNEVYSVQGVEFDRQELRKLVREVHIAQEVKAASASEEEEKKKIERAVFWAKKDLTRFLRSLSKRITDEY